jgi:hypothetical protein
MSEGNQMVLIKKADTYFSIWVVFQNKAHGQTYYAVSENLLYVILSFHQMSSAYF